MSEVFQTPKKPLKESTLTIPASPFLKKLGYGTGVLVYEFVRSPKVNSIKSPWAVKMLNSRIKNKVYQTRLRTEAELLRKMNNPYIVGFRQFTKNLDGKECLAMEECTTSLDNLIEKRFEELNLAFPSIKILKVASDLSKAMDYLHGTILLLHADIKSHNVLIQGDFDICKLCDFGVSLPLKSNGELDAIKAGTIEEYEGTISWCAPEVLKYPPIITSKADIFASGLVLWEMIALDIPHANSDENCDIINLDDSDVPQETFGTRPAIPDHTFDNNIDEYKYPLEIFYLCTEEDYKTRIKAKDLLSLIEEMNEQ